MTVEEHTLGFISDESARLNVVEINDDPEGLAGAIAAAELIIERATPLLNGRVSAQDIADGKAAAKTALGW